MTVEEAKKNLIRAYMEEIKEINELQEICSKDINRLLKNIDNKIKKYEELKKQREIILTELNILSK